MKKKKESKILGQFERKDYPVQTMCADCVAVNIKVPLHSEYRHYIRLAKMFDIFVVRWYD